MRLVAARGIEGLHTPRHALFKIDRRPRYRDLACGDPGHVDKIVDELRQILQLASDCAAGLLAGLVMPPDSLQDAEWRADDAEGVSELVRQHGDELVLSHVTILDFSIKQTVLDGDGRPAAEILDQHDRVWIRGQSRGPEDHPQNA